MRLIKIEYNLTQLNKFKSHNLSQSSQPIQLFYLREESSINLHRYLFWGIVLLGIGIALIIILFIELISGHFDDNTMGFGLIFLFTGLGILLFYKIQSKKEKEKKEKISTN